MSKLKKLSNSSISARFLYNSALQERISYYKKYKQSISYNKQSAALTEIKPIFYNECDKIHSQALQSILKRLDNSYSNFFRRVKSGDTPGFPRFKNKNSFNSLLYPQCDFNSGGVKIVREKKIKLKKSDKTEYLPIVGKNQKIIIHGVTGTIRLKYHRPYSGNCKTISLIRQNDHYYISLSCENIEVKTQLKTGKIISLDLGIDSFAVSNTGNKYKSPRPYKTAKEYLAYKNAKLAKKQKNSNNYLKLRRDIRKQNQKIVNIRHDFLHKLSNKIVKKNDSIIIEDLNISNMLKSTNNKVDKSNITDVSWGTFIEYISYKAERAGIEFIKVNPKNTSKRCCKCRNIDMAQTLADRRYDCKSCGFAIDRDHNAAINIYRLGISRLIS